MRNKCSTSEHIAQLVRNCLEEGQSVDIDGLGLFRNDKAGGFEFIPQSNPVVFLAYVEEDRLLADRFGDEFRKYQEYVPAYIPFLR